MRILFPSIILFCAFSHHLKAQEVSDRLLDQAGRPIAVKSEKNLRVFGYGKDTNKLERLVVMTYPNLEVVSTALSYTDGKLTQLSNSKGQILNLSYDRSGNLASLADSSKIVDIVNDPISGRPILFKTGERSGVTVKYDSSGKIEKVEHWTGESN